MTLIEELRYEVEYPASNNAILRDRVARAVAAIEAHDARVTELLEANNREVERRREAETLAEKCQGVIRVLLRSMRIGP